jgi:hypothetical protein
MPVEIITGRGVYRLSATAPLERKADGSFVLTLTMERTDGIERLATKCRIVGTPLHEEQQTDAILQQVKPWIARDFEHTREAALRAIRSERRLHEIIVHLGNPSLSD